jgi:predicted HAD superfamily Cof-like phosphohydrolase
MKSAIEDVLEFHRRFSVPRSIVPRRGDPNGVRLSRSLIDEEYEELHDALSELEAGHEKSDHVRYHMVKAADSIVDLIYVCISAGIKLGVPMQRVWAAVHAANMLKEPDPKGGKVRKPAGWVEPDIAACLWPKEEDNGR